jgi:hypothetical protein
MLAEALGREGTALQTSRKRLRARPGRRANIISTTSRGTSFDMVEIEYQLPQFL